MLWNEVLKWFVCLLDLAVIPIDLHYSVKPFQRSILSYLDLNEIMNCTLDLDAHRLCNICMLHYQVHHDAHAGSAHRAAHPHHSQPDGQAYPAGYLVPERKVLFPTSNLQDNFVIMA